VYFLIQIFYFLCINFLGKKLISARVIEFSNQNRNIFLVWLTGPIFFEKFVWLTDFLIRFFQFFDLFSVSLFLFFCCTVLLNVCNLFLAIPCLISYFLETKFVTISSSIVVPISHLQFIARCMHTWLLVRTRQRGSNKKCNFYQGLFFS